MTNQFLEARNRFKEGNLTFGTKGYLESLYTQTGKIPRRLSNETFDRALNFHNKQKKQFEDISKENKYLKDQLATYEEVASKAAKAMKQQRNLIDALNSKSKASNVASNDSYTRSGGSSSDSANEQTVDFTGKGDAGSVSGAVLPSDVPDTCGHSDKHADEGRQAELQDERTTVQGSGEVADVGSSERATERSVRFE